MFFLVINTINLNSHIEPIYYLICFNFVIIIVTMTIWTPDLSSTTTSKYEAIAEAIAEDVSTGALTPGQKLPPQRELARRLSVTIGTIGRAYALAEKRGLISLEVGRGSFVRSFESRSNELGSRGDVIDLGLNLPPVTEHDDLLARTLAQISNSRNIVTLFGNAPVESFEQHRAAAAKWLSDRVACSSEDVLICSGTQNALISALATLTNPGDSILVEELTFPGLIAAAKLLHLELVAVKMDDQGIIPAELDQAARNSNVLYCIPTNQNPTTATMSKSRRREIAKIADRRDLSIIEDDVYGKLIENAPAPLATYAIQRTILISSLAKTLSLGLRLAIVRVPDALRQNMMANMRATNFFPSPLLCEIAANWINDDTATELLHEQRAIAHRRQQIAREVLQKEWFQGDPHGNHMWLNLPDAWTAETLERASTENGVNLYTATAFSPAGTPHPNAVRIALGAARHESELRIGLNVIARLLADGTDRCSVRY